jgi:hypothetical protein
MVILPVLVLTARPLGDATARPWGSPPAPHSVDLEGRHTESLDFDEVGARRASRDGLNAAITGSSGAGAGLQSQVLPDRAGALGGFTLVGSVAVLTADDTMVTRNMTGYGITPAGNLAAVTSRFIQVFGDDYDQIAVFLSFPDRLSPNALAYLQPVKNDVKGLGMDLYDRTMQFGSAGRMQAVLNMKRINLYGRDAANDLDNNLYPVWAQEAAHRWLVYFRFQQMGQPVSAALLGRQMAHWERGVQVQGSIMDGYDWKDNMDGTYTPGKRAFRYGELDQYGMGLRKAAEVAPFFWLKDLKDMAGTPISTMVGLAAGGRYQATRVDLTVDDIIRAVGPREPATDTAAQDLRMGVMLLAQPEKDAADLVGEAAQIDHARKAWTDFYNMAGGGRGMVCTDLLHPCRGEAFSFGNVVLEEAANTAEPDGVIGRGEAFTLNVEITNIGNQTARAGLVARAAGLAFDAPAAAGPMVAMGQTAKVSVTGRVLGDVVCGQPVTLDLSVAGARGQSRELRDVIVGLVPKKVEGFEGDAAAAGWKVNPDGADMGVQGRWASGTPARSVFKAADFTLQPGAAYSGLGAFVTGLSEAETDNVEGQTTLESPPFALSGLRAPTLSYQVYFVSTDFADEVLVPDPSGVLKVQASIDGGPFTDVDVVTGMSSAWQRKVVPLAAKLGAGLSSAANVRFRFVAQENTLSTHPVVEVALDEVGIYDQAPSCGAVVAPVPDGAAPGPTAAADKGGGGCACTIGSARAAADDRGRRRGQAAPGWALGLVAAALLWPHWRGWRGRHRSRSESRPGQS